MINELSLLLSNDISKEAGKLALPTYTGLQLFTGIKFQCLNRKTRDYHH